MIFLETSFFNWILTQKISILAVEIENYHVNC